jgi:hypothetical protein
MALERVEEQSSTKRDVKTLEEMSQGEVLVVPKDRIGLC